MKLTIIAATGGIGRHLLGQALAAGHEVTAVVRTPAKLAGTPARVIGADLATAEPSALLTAVAGADAVLSGLGARSRAEAGVVRQGTSTLLQAMTRTGVQRLVVVSAASVGTVPSPARPNPPRHNPGDGPFMRHLAAPVAKAAFRAYYADLALMEDDVRASKHLWTVVRPPRLLNTRLTGTYRVAFEQNVRAGMFISRADVAHHMLDVVRRPETFRRVTGLAY